MKLNITDDQARVLSLRVGEEITGIILKWSGKQRKPGSSIYANTYNSCLDDLEKFMGVDTEKLKKESGNG